MAVIFDKLTIINDCLIASGNNPVNELDDGSSEWVAASSAYERFLPIVLGSENWSFGNKIADLQRFGDADYPGYTDIYHRPSDCVHIESIWRNDAASLIAVNTANLSMPRSDIRAPAMPYDLIGGKVYCNAPLGASCKYIAAPNNDLTQMPPLFLEALRLYIQSVLESGLNQDHAVGAALYKKAEALTISAASRDDQQDPRRALFRSSTLERRRRRVM